MSEQLFIIATPFSPEDEGIAGVYEWQPRAAAEFLPAAHRVNAALDAFHHSVAIGNLDECRIVVVNAAGVEQQGCDALEGGEYVMFGDIVPSDRHMASFQPTQPVAGTIGLHDWCIADLTDTGSFGYAVHVDDRPVGNRDTYEAAIGLAQAMCLSLDREGLGRLNDHPAGFLVPMMPVNGFYLVRCSLSGLPGGERFMVAGTLDSLHEALGKLPCPGDWVAFNTVRMQHTGLYRFVRPDGALVDTLNPYGAFIRYENLEALVAAEGPYSPVTLSKMDDRAPFDSPEWYDTIELHGVRQEDGYVEQDDDEPDFFSVYLHFKTGGLECVGDHATYELALLHASDLAKKYGWPRMDCIALTGDDSSALAEKQGAEEPAEIVLPAFGIRIRGCSITSDLHDAEESSEQKAALDAIEAMILGHAMAGINVQESAYLAGIEAAVTAIWQHHD
ncbi:hypothetical protein [Gulbenkiania mobilis]|uniref:hypothetical protein n=1 Tax=Gulbenkiania mobilis TaxID=397457 RepID=UPI0006BC0B2F|nr:hypothetical protein [Gulbenkiania mobilis]